MIRRKRAFRNAASLIRHWSVEKTQKAEGGTMVETEGDEIVNSTAVCLHLSIH